MKARILLISLISLVVGLLLSPMPLIAVDSNDDPDSKELSIMVGFWAQHVDTSDDTNENINLLGISYRSYIVSRFKNSYYDETFFAGKRFHTKRRTPSNKKFYIQGNLYAGVMYGYGDNLPNIGGVTAGLLPTLGVGYIKASLEMGYIPTPHGGVFLSMFRYMF